MKKQDKTKAVTTRFPIAEYHKLLDSAEQQGTTIADVIRSAWTQSQEQQQIQQQLLMMEQRQQKSSFEMMCAVINVKPHERQQAIEDLNQLGIRW